MAEEKRLCNFCAETEDKVKFMIAGLGTYICDGCVRLAVAVIQEKDPTFLTDNDTEWMLDGEK